MRENMYCAKMSTFTVYHICTENMLRYSSGDQHIALDCYFVISIYSVRYTFVTNMKEILAVAISRKAFDPAK